MEQSFLPAPCIFQRVAMHSRFMLNFPNLSLTYSLCFTEPQRYRPQQKKKKSALLGLQQQYYLVSSPREPRFGYDLCMNIRISIMVHGCLNETNWPS